MGRKHHLQVTMTWYDDSQTGHLVVTEAGPAETWSLVLEQPFGSWRDISGLWIVLRLWLALRRETDDEAST